jgi:hypothetical protein
MILGIALGIVLGAVLLLVLGTLASMAMVVLLFVCEILGWRGVATVSALLLWLGWAVLFGS